ncbi:MAG: alpha/beta hydrolase [Gammaproteobacteria bacterium]|nr:alpha/beta hydrolase [Gammaproteobacteria bacterium]
MTIKTVICAHGFWSHGTGMYLIKRRLEKEFGFQAHLFSYRSVHGTLDENAAALYRFIEQLDVDGAHLVGHSLGGVLALRMLANYKNALPGRVVCLGSPLTGSRAATILGAQEWAENIIGRSLSSGVIDESANTWASHVCEERDIGVIAGNVPLGFGRLFANFDEDNDGTIAVSETRLAGARDHLVMPVSHKGMLVSSDVADQAGSFLKRGEFLRDA